MAERQKWFVVAEVDENWEYAADDLYLVRDESGYDLVLGWFDDRAEAEAFLARQIHLCGA